MTPQELFAQADLAGLHSRVAAEIRTNPQLAEPRALFVQVLCLEGEWERATAQADALLKLSPASALFCTTIARLIEAEQTREQVFAGTRAPEWSGTQPAYAADVCSALHAYGSGDTAAAAAATLRVMDALVPAEACVDGATHPWVIDADARLAGVVEYLKDGHYCLVAQSEIKSMEIAVPSHPVELLWPHVRITLRNGEVLVGRTTGRYPLTPAAKEPKLLMMQESAWQEVAENLYLGSGQHCLATPESELPLLTLARLTFA